MKTTSRRAAPRAAFMLLGGLLALTLAGCGGDSGSRLTGFVPATGNDSSGGSKAPANENPPAGNGGSRPETPVAKRPNFLVILADDMGYSDIGAFGSEIATPNIDALMRDGRLLTRFYAAPACSPTRGMLMTGADSHRVGLGAMENNVTSLVSSRNAPFGVDFTYDNIPPGYGGHLVDGALSMPQLFKDAGYHTYMAGKWHLAYEFSDATGGSRFLPAAYPNKKGFERSFALLDGAGAHFAPRSGVPPTRYDTTTYTEDDVAFPATQLPADFYSTRSYTDKLLSYLESNRGSGKPFFAYAAYTAPHWPLQAPDADIAAQKGRYDEGYDVIRARRIAKMKQLGVLPQNFVENAGLASVSEGGTGKKRWTELSADERARQARAMEVYAAMVSNLDTQIGRLVTYLRETGQYEDTVIFFMSDNGADSNPAAGAAITAATDLDSIGKQGSAVAYGERWAEVSAAPFRLWKTFTGAEGSVSVPAMIKLQGKDQGRVAMVSPALVKDLLPTFLDMAGIALPTQQYAGKAIVPVTGVSLRGALQSASAVPVVRPPTESVAFEYLGQGYVNGPDGWKLSRTAVPGMPTRTYADLPWKLFNTLEDRGETKDRAAERPDLVDALKKEWEQYVLGSQVLVPATPPAAKRDPAAL
ncbi:arylsulfatase [Pseudacidovorax intermedius]|uniref:arylsulfatase n=1 Tax=Pseudacidovorax intermedius TaxID=433924 RepID=UPI0026EA4268|nr:arylsulfatase [Pseudacidovorax intermedius]